MIKILRQSHHSGVQVVSSYIVIFLFAATQCLAQKLPFVNYTTASGLIHNRTHVVRQDGKGFIWMGTDMGICRFDGRSFKHFPAPENSYFSARTCTVADGKVYFGVDHCGIAVCDGDSVQFLRPQNHAPGAINGLAFLNDTTFLYNKAEEGLVRLSRQKLEVWKQNPYRFVELYKDYQGNVWIGAINGATFLPKGDVASAVALKNLEGFYINAFRQDGAGSLYIICEKGVLRLSKEQVLKKDLEHPELVVPPVIEFTGAAFDQDGNMWLSSTFKGIYKYSFVEKKLSNYGVENGLVTQNAWDVFCDRENNIWVATENGVSKLSNTSYKSFDLSNTDYSNVKSLELLRDGSVLFTNGRKFFRQYNGLIEEVKGFEDIPGYLEQRTMQMDDGTIWITQNEQNYKQGYDVMTYIYKLKDNVLRRKHSLSIFPNAPRAVFFHLGTVRNRYGTWMLSSKGLQLFDGHRFHTYELTRPDGSKIEPYYITAYGDSSLLINDQHKNIINCRIETTQNGLLPCNLRIRQFIPATYLRNDWFTKMFVDSRRLVWLASKIHGLIVMNSTKESDIDKILLLPGDVLSSKLITDMEEDKYGNMWIGSSSGIDKITFRNWFVTVRKDLYGSELCGKYIFFLRAVNNKLFIGTTGCLGIADILKQPRAVPPQVFISGLTIYDKNSSNLLRSSWQQLKSEDNTITFQFTATSYTDEKKIKYRYMLEGMDKGWSKPTSEYRITYTKLPPGNYRFLVQAQSATGIWSVSPAAYSFSIAQPFYTTWWFIALAILLIILIAYSLYRYRINQILAIQNIRHKISKDLHDDIGATISSIGILSSMAKEKIVDEQKKQQFMERIAKDSKYVSEALSDIVWAINPKNDSLEMIFARLLRYAYELFEARNITYRVSLPEQDIKEIYLNMDSRQHLYLIIKEVINNLVKYSQASEASIVVSCSRSNLSIEVSDNGVGFDPENTQGNGLQNIRKRAAELKATIAIRSKYGFGTTVLLDVPVRKYQKM